MNCDDCIYSYIHPDEIDFIPLKTTCGALNEYCYIIYETDECKSNYKVIPTTPLKS